MTCDRCGRSRPICLRFGTLAPGFPCGLSHYAEILWLVPCAVVLAVVFGLKWLFKGGSDDRT